MSVYYFIFCYTFHCITLYNVLYLMAYIGLCYCFVVAKDLVKKLLIVDPNKRLSISEALQHPWFNVRDREMFVCLSNFTTVL